MAALSSSVPSISSLPLPASVVVLPPRRCGNNPVTTTASALHQRRCLSAGLTSISAGMNNGGLPPIRGSTRISAVDPGNPGSGPFGPFGPNLPIPGVPQWSMPCHVPNLLRAQWLVGAFVFAVPLYRQFRAMEDKVEQTAEAAIEIIEKVAEETEKIADEVAESFPGNEKLKAVASKIKAVADVIEEDADKAEALIKKVDEIEKEIDAIVDKVANQK